MQPKAKRCLPRIVAAEVLLRHLVPQMTMSTASTHDERSDVPSRHDFVACFSRGTVESECRGYVRAGSGTGVTGKQDLRLRCRSGLYIELPELMNVFLLSR